MAVPPTDVVNEPTHEPLPQVSFGNWLVKEASQPPVMGVRQGLVITQQESQAIFQFVEVNRLLEQDGAAYQDQVLVVTQKVLMSSML